MSELLPPQAHVLAAQIEDALRDWNKRPAQPSHLSVAALKTAIDRTGDLIVCLSLFRDDLYVSYMAHGGNAPRWSETSTSRCETRPMIIPGPGMIMGRTVKSTSAFGREIQLRANREKYLCVWTRNPTSDER